MLKGLSGSALMAAVVFYVQAWLRTVRGLSHEDMLVISHVFPLRLRRLVLWVGRLIAPPPARPQGPGPDSS